MKLSIVIPVYNEEKTLEKLVRRVMTVKLAGVGKEIIIVDDKSTDGSRKIMKILKQRHPDFELVFRSQQGGKGAAVRDGLKEATGDYVLIQDADLEYDPQNIPKLLAPIFRKEAEVVYGTRLNRLPNFRNEERTVRFLFHYLGNRFLSLLASLFYGQWLTDIETGHKVFPRKAVAGMKLSARGFEFEPEITSKLLKKGYKIKEISISVTPRGYDEGKKLKTIKDGGWAFWSLFKYRFFDWFVISSILILVLAFIFRFYDYQNRWGLGYDQAHDALVARYAIEAGKIPLVGPFSSAGPFQTGGQWYWLLMGAYFLFPDILLAPWLLITFLHVVFVFLAILLGKQLLGRKFGILLGILAAFSSAQISQSTNLTVTAPMAIISLLAIGAMINFLKKKSPKFLFSLGFLVGLAPAIHLQGVSLVFLLLITLLFTGIPKRKSVFSLLLGLLLALTPLIIFDLNYHWVNSGNMLRYYFHEQYKISFDVLGRRWLTYLGVFWPKAWSYIIGGERAIGWLLIAIVTIGTFYNFFKRKIPKEWYVIILSFLAAVVLIRYTRTPLFDSYLVLLHPFVLLLSGWAIFTIFKKNVPLGFLLLAVVLLGSTRRTFLEIWASDKSTAQQVNMMKNEILAKFPEEKFAIYDYQYQSSSRSLPLALFLDVDSKIDDYGFKIGLIKGKLVNLNKQSHSQLLENGWRFVNPSSVYKSTEEWLE